MKKVLISVIVALGVQTTHAVEALTDKSVDLCSGSGKEVAFIYQYCSSTTEITLLEGFCDASGRLYYKDVATKSCTAWSSLDIFDIEEERLAQKFCHECSEGVPVCSSSSDHDEVCAQVAAPEECTAGLTHEEDQWACSETGEIEVVFAACRANGTNVSMDAFTGPCSDIFGFGDHSCYKCDGFTVVCGPQNSTCEELLSNSTVMEVPAEQSVDLCAESGKEVAYFYQYCSSTTEITQFSGLCDPSGRLFGKEASIISCAAWSALDIFDIEEERLAQKYCHECSEGVPVCSSSSDHDEVCAQVAAPEECIVGLTYEEDQWACSETGETENVVAACRANGTNVSMPITWQCDIFGVANQTCYKCDDFAVICGPPNSSCEELLGDSTASSSVLAPLSASDLLLWVAAAFCGIELLGGVAWY